MTPEMMKMIAFGIGGWALAFGWNIGADWFRRRGSRKLRAAERDVERARLTPDEKDDLIAKMALERAQDDAEFMAWLADHIEKNRPTIPKP